MNIFIKKNVRIFTGLISCFILFFVLLSLIPSLSFAETKTLYSGYGANVTQTVTSGIGFSSGLGGSSYSGGAPKNFYELVMNTIIRGMLRPVITLIISAAVVVFLYGVFKFIRSDGKEKETGKEFMVWGLVGLFVMMSVWGLVNILRNTFNLNDSTLNISKVLLK